MERLFSLLDIIVSKLPFSLLSIPLIINDWHAVALLPITILLDFFVPGLFALYQSYYAYRKLKKECQGDGFFTGNFEVLNSELVYRLNSFTFSTSLLGPRRLGIGTKLITKFNKSIKVVLSDKISTRFTTILDTWEESIIIVKRWFDEQEIKDVARLAHEFGHVYHSFKRAEFYGKAFTVALFLLVMLYCAVTGGVSWPLLVALPLGLIVFVRYSRWIESYCESMSDIYVLTVFESLWGQDAMVKAAKLRIKERIYTCRQTKYGNKMGLNRGERFVMYVSINYMARFLSIKDCEELIAASVEKSSRIKEDAGLNETERDSMLSIEKLIRQALERNKNICLDSTENLTFNDTNVILSVSYLTCFVMACIALFTTFKDISFTWQVPHMWTVLIIAIIIFVLYQLIILLLWNMKTKLKRKIGLC